MPEDKNKGIDFSKWKNNPTRNIQDVQYHGQAADFGKDVSQYDDPNIPNIDLDQGEYKYIRGEKQSWADKAGNGVIRLAGRAATSGAEGILTPFVGTFYAIKDGKFSSFYDNPVTRSLDNIDKSIKDELPLYNTHESENATGLSKLLYANTLFGDIFDGVGYSIGSIATGGLYTKLASAIGKTAVAGGNVARMTKELSALESAADKAAYIDKINKTNKLKNGIDNGTIAFIGATAESGANARSDKNELKEKLINEVSQNGKIQLTKEQLDRIELLAEKAGNSSFVLNLPTIMLDNWITFGKSVFGNKVTDKKNLLGIGAGLEVTDDTYKAAKKSVIKNIVDNNYGKIEFIKPFVAEGTQEQIQYAISKGTNDYYKKRYYNPDSASFIGSMIKGLGEAYGTTEGWDNFMIGALSGGMFGNATKMATEGMGAYKDPYKGLDQTAIDILNNNKSKEAYTELIKGVMTHGNIVAEQEEALKNNNTFDYENLKNDAFFNHVMTRLKTGREQDLYDKMEEFKNMSPEELKSNFGTELSEKDRNNVLNFVQSKIEKAKDIQSTFNIINERFPNASLANKERLTYSTMAVKNARERKDNLINETQKILHEERFTGSEADFLIPGLTTFTKLDEAQRQEFIHNISKENVSMLPLNKERVLENLIDVDKLIKREKQFIEEYKELLNPSVQQKLDEVDADTEEQVKDNVKDKPETPPTNVEGEEDNTFTNELSPEEAEAFVNATVGQSDTTNTTSQATPLEAPKQQTASTSTDIEAKKADIERRRKEELASIQFNDNPFEENKDWASRPDSKGPLQNYGATKEEVQSKVNAKYDAELAALEGTSQPTQTQPVESSDVYDDQDAISEALVNNNTPGSLITEDKNTVQTINVDGKSIASMSNVAMMKLAEGGVNPATGNFSFRHNEKGEVILTGSSVTMDVNNPEVAKEGSEIEFRIVELTPAEKKSAQEAIEFSRKQIDNAMRHGNPYGYTNEDLAFSAPEYTTPIGIYQDGKLIGYVQIPHWINEGKDSKVDPLLYAEVRKKVIAERKIILQKLKEGKVTTKIVKKGSGNMVSRVINKKSDPQGNLLKEVRPEDKFGKIAVFAYVGLSENFIIEGNERLKEAYADINNRKAFGMKGAMYQVVKNANGTNSVIPVYSTLIKEPTANKIIETIKNLPDNPTLNEVLSALNPYIYISNKKETNASMGYSVEDKKFKIDNHRLSLDSIRNNPATQETLKKALLTKYHNISRKEINSPVYQRYLAENNILQTNAYTINGQYFIQPFIEYESLIQGNPSVKKEAEEAKSNIDDVLNKGKDFQTKRNINRDNFGTVFSRKKEISPLDRKAVQAFLNKYTPWLTLSDVDKVSKVKGVIKDAVGAFRDNVIYLFEGASNKTAYHEAFHGVFRSMLTYDEAEQIYNEAAKIYGKPTAQELKSLQEEFSEDAFHNMRNEEITAFLYDRWLEEKMADDFADFANNFTEKSTWQKIKDFFKELLEWFGIFKVTPKNKVELLFENIIAKKYAKTKPIIRKKDPGYVYSRASIGRLPVTVKDERVNAITNRFLSKYAMLLRSGESKIKSQDILQSILKEYMVRYQEEMSKSDSEFNEPVFNTLTEVLENWVSFEQEVAQLVKVKMGFDVKTNKFDDIQDTVNNEDLTDVDINMEGSTTKDGGFGELTTKSGIDSASKRLKLLFSSIPVIENGQVKKDRFGFPIFHSYEKIYYYVERNLIGLKTIEEMQEALGKAAIFRPELGAVKEMITRPIGESSKGFEKLQNDFLSNFRKQLMQYYLVLLDKKGDNDFSYKFVNSNREGVALEIYHSWINNLNQQTSDIITDFSQDEPQINGTKKAIDLYDQFKTKRSSITASELRKMLTKVGVTYSEGVIEKAFDTKKEELLGASEKVLKFFATPKSHDNINTIERDGRKALGDLVKYELAGNLTNYTTSVNNVEDKTVYPIQNPSWISDIESSIKGVNSDALYEEFKKDPILKYSNLVKDLWEETYSEDFRDSKFKILYLNGLKNSKGEFQGAKFTKMVKEDWLLTQLTLFQNSVQDQNMTATPTAIYTNITPADKTLEVLWEGRKYHSYLDKGVISPNSEIVGKFYNIVLGEANRIKTALDDKRRTQLPISDPNYLSKDKLLKHYHFNDGSAVDAFDGAAYRFNFLNINNVEFNKQDGTRDTLLNILKERLETMSVEEALNPIKNKIENLIVKELMITYNRALEEAKKSGMIAETIVNGKTFLTPQTLEVPGNKNSEGVVVSMNIEEKDDYIKRLIRSWATNSYLANIEFSTMMNGDPAYYKNKKGIPSDMPKRFYQAQSMVIRINEKVIPNLKAGVVADYNTNADEESVALLEKHAPESKKSYVKKGGATNVTDAQVWVLPEVYKKLKEARGIWTDEDEKAHRIAEGLEKPDMEDNSWRNRLNAIKPFGYGNVMNKDLNRLTPIQLKCSIMPLYDSIIADNSLLKEHKAKMIKESIQMLATESSLKALMPQTTELSDTDGKYSTIDIPTEIFGFQVDNPDHMVDSENSSIRQLKMIIPGNIDPNIDYNGRSGQDIINELNNLEAANIDSDLNNTLKRTNSSEFNEYLQEALTSRKATNVTKKILEVNNEGKFSYPLNLVNTTTIENMISSVFTKRVIKQEFKNGGSTVQASSVGYKFDSKYRNLAEQQEDVKKDPALRKVQSSLKWIRAKDENSIDYIECAMPAWTKKFFDSEGKLLKNVPDEVRTLIAYRIPSEGFHSAMAIKVVKFLPPEMGNFMLLPEQVTTQFGADFDFDKTYFIGPEFYKKGSKLVRINYLDNNNSTLEQRYNRYILNEHKRDINALKKEFNIDETYEAEELLSHKAFMDDILTILRDEGKIPTLEDFASWPIENQNTKAARNTRIFDNYDTILRSNNTLKYLVKPSGFQELQDIASKLGEDIELPNYYDAYTQNFYKDLFHSIIGLKGQIANHVTGHSYMTMMNLTVNDKYAIKFNKDKDGNYKVYDNLSRLKSDNDGLISEEESMMMAAILDAVKNPQLLPALGINDQSIDIWATLIHLGLGVENASLYTAQPAIKELTIALRSNYKQAREADFKAVKVEDIIQKYTEELENELAKIEDLGKVDFFRNHGYGIKGVENKYTPLETEFLKKYATFQKDPNLANNPEARIWFLAYQIRCLNTFNKIKPVSDYIVDINRFLSVNKEVGPNIENIADKVYLKEQLSQLNEYTPVLGFNVKTIPQLNAYYNAHESALDYFNSQIPYMSRLYKDIKDKVAAIQYGGTVLDIPHKDRNTINGFIKAFIDHSFSEFSTIDSLAERKNLFTNFATKISQIKSLQDKDDMLSDYEKANRKSLRDSAFISQLTVTFQDGLGFISLKGNKLSDIEKNQIIASGLALWKNPDTRELFANLIKYSYLSSGFFTGLNSFHSLIDPSIFDEFGKDKNYVDFQREMLEKSNRVMLEQDSDRLLDQLVRNFPKKFTDTFEQKFFAGFEKEGKPDEIIVDKIKAAGTKMVVGQDENGNNIYVKYIRVYSKKYGGSLLYKWSEGDTFVKVSYLGKAGSLVEINSKDDIEASIIKKNNYSYETEEAANSKIITNPFGTPKDKNETNSSKNDDLFNTAGEFTEGLDADQMSTFIEKTGIEEKQKPKVEETPKEEVKKKGFLINPSPEQEQNFGNILGNANKIDPDDKVKPCD